MLQTHIPSGSNDRLVADPCKVLIVDDDPACAEAYAEIVAELGYLCRVELDALSALRALATDSELGIVLTDISMPEMDGITFLNEVASRFESARPIITIALTGLDSLGVAVDAMRNNASDFLTKPVSMQDLAAALRRAMVRWARLRANAMPSPVQIPIPASLPAMIVPTEDPKPEKPNEDMLSQVRAIVRTRRRRADFLDSELFADPVWDILLDLTSARLEGKPVPVMSACAAAQVPVTTALRYLQQLQKSGLVRRWTDPSDRRRVLIEIEDETFASMQNYLRSITR